MAAPQLYQSPLEKIDLIIITLYTVCSVHRGMFSTAGGYHEYIGDIMSTSGDIMSTSGDVQYIEGIP